MMAILTRLLHKKNRLFGNPRFNKFSGGELHLFLEKLESRQLLSLGSDYDGWRSAIFNDGFDGTLDLQFSRDLETVNYLGEEVAADVPRYGQSQLVSETDDAWTLSVSNVGTEWTIIAGSGWDHDGITPLAVVIDLAVKKLIFIRGDDLSIINTFDYRMGEGADLLQGTVPGYRYLPVHAIVHEGLVVFFTKRERFENDTYITEGVTFIYTQDLGQTFHRVAQAGGGWDVPAIAGGVSDGMDRGQRWCFSNAFPESSPDDRLGAWFPWTDYIFRIPQQPHGGQVGLFRARRAAVGEPWVVEPNVIVQERWELADAGGFHAHSAGMFTDGLVSFWGDVDYRNHMERHIASDLENYTLATWTHVTEFNGAWSPDDAKVYRIGNQGASTAPGPEFGQVLVTGDEQPELIMLVEAPENSNDPAIITNLLGTVLGTQQGWRYTGRLSLWIHYLPGRGYVAHERAAHNNKAAIYFSANGITWSSILSHTSIPCLYGDRIFVLSDGDLLSTSAPDEYATLSPLVIHPGGENLVGTDWEMITEPGSGNSWRSVIHQDGHFLYADTFEFLNPQPVSAPPVVEGTRIWEVTTGSASKLLGTWNVGAIASDLSAEHWMTAWFYPLEGDGIDPGLSLYNQTTPYITSRWVANQQWVPSFTFGIPDPDSIEPEPVSVSTFSGLWPASPNRWLMAIEGIYEGSSPTYPLAPNTIGSDEIASIADISTTNSWTIGMMFGLPDISAFTGLYDPSGYGTVHPIATLVESVDDYIQINMIRTSRISLKLTFDVFVGGTLSSQVVFSPIYFDVLDTARIMISGGANRLGITVLLPRNEFGTASQMVLLESQIQPSDIYFSDITQSTVTPLEWYAIQVHERINLSTAEREAFIASDQMFTSLDGDFQPGDFDYDGDVDGYDYLPWKTNFGLYNSWHARGDSDEDGDIDGNDFLVWQSQFEIIPIASGNFDHDDDVDDNDVRYWRQNFGNYNTSHLSGDGDGDHDIDGNDFLIWQIQYDPYPNPFADFDCDCNVDSDDLATWQANFGSLAGTPATGDADGDEDIDGNDFLAWQNQMGKLESLAGDFNSDCEVDGIDFDIWQANALSLNGTPAKGDADDDADIDGNDFLIWQSQFGASYWVTPEEPDPMSAKALSIQAESSQVVQASFPPRQTLPLVTDEPGVMELALDRAITAATMVNRAFGLARPTCPAVSLLAKNMAGLATEFQIGEERLHTDLPHHPSAMKVTESSFRTDIWNTPHASLGKDPSAASNDLVFDSMHLVDYIHENEELRPLQPTNPYIPIIL